MILKKKDYNRLFGKPEPTEVELAAKRRTRWWAAGLYGSVAICLLGAFVFQLPCDRYWGWIATWVVFLYLLRELLLFRSYLQYKSWYREWSASTPGEHPRALAYRNFRADYFHDADRGMDSLLEQVTKDDKTFHSLVERYGARLDLAEFDNRGLSSAERRVFKEFREVGYGPPRPGYRGKIDFEEFEKSRAEQKAAREEAKSTPAPKVSEFGVSESRVSEIRCHRLYHRDIEELGKSHLKWFLVMGIVFSFFSLILFGGCLVAVFELPSYYGVVSAIGVGFGVAWLCYYSNYRTRCSYKRGMGDPPTDEELKALDEYDKAEQRWYSLQR